MSALLHNMLICLHLNMHVNFEIKHMFCCIKESRFIHAELEAHFLRCLRICIIYGSVHTEKPHMVDCHVPVGLPEYSSHHL